MKKEIKKLSEEKAISEVLQRKFTLGDSINILGFDIKIEKVEKDFRMYLDDKSKIVPACAYWEDQKIKINIKSAFLMRNFFHEVKHFINWINNTPKSTLEFDEYVATRESSDWLSIFIQLSNYQDQERLKLFYELVKIKKPKKKKKKIKKTKSKRKK